MELAEYTWQYQYDGRAPWREIVWWCCDNLEHYQAHWETITFWDEREYTLFLLRWS